ncbi:MAG TPA: EVE domain-containing protein [Bacillota bacterium]
MAYWLLKTEPGEYAYADLERVGTDRWDGVRNAVALKHLRAMRPGDLALIYHTGSERAIVGVAEIVSDPYPDPAAERWPVVDVRARRRLPRPVTLAEIKADPAFAAWELVRLPRLSVMPVPDEHWRRILAMAGASPG